MHNHVITKIKAPSNVIKALESEKSKVDFSNIIEIPKEFYEFDGGFTSAFDELVEKLVDFIIKHQQENQSEVETDVHSLIDEFFENRKYELTETVKKYKKEIILQTICLLNYGYKNPVDWLIANWDTKWNAYNIEQINENEVSFHTACTHPFNVIGVLSQKFPNDEIHIEFEDEDLGHNCGKYTIKNGDCYNIREKASGTKDDVIFAMNVRNFSDDEKKEILEDKYEENEMLNFGIVFITIIGIIFCWIFWMPFNVKPESRYLPEPYRSQKVEKISECIKNVSTKPNGSYSTNDDEGLDEAIMACERAFDYAYREFEVVNYEQRKD